ncbi:hypothetical protein KAH81_09225 [bacterium]|nr:hypothetical protein [bacterium]
MSNKKPPKLKPFSVKKDEVSKALTFLTTEQLLVKEISLGDESKGYRWELYRGEIPFWVDLIRFSEQVDLLVAYSIMFQLPDSWDKTEDAKLYKFLLELNDFSMSWDTKFFLKGRTVLLCASRSGEEINSNTARYLADSFSRFAGILSRKIGEEFPNLVKFVVGKPEGDGEEDEST